MRMAFSARLVRALQSRVNFSRFDYWRSGRSATTGAAADWTVAGVLRVVMGGLL
jgi:hypothetical protein